MYWFDQPGMSILLYMEEFPELTIKPVLIADKSWVEEFYVQRWGSSRVVTRGTLYHVPDLPGFIAWKDGSRIGLLTYHAAGAEIEIVTLDSLEQGKGVGTALISKMLSYARRAQVDRLWLITTNDNTPALNFYQKKGFSIARFHKNAVLASREIKPEIPEIGLDGIPIRDEIELEIRIT